jgi:hypothetical protein
LGEVAGLGATGAGLIGNLAADHQRSIAAKEAQANANLSPQALGNEVTAATAPLNASLVQAVTGATNANLAEQGLSEAPGLIAQATTQGLAPYAQQNQQNALQLVMRKLGLPAEFAATIPQNAQLAPLLAMLMKSFSAPGATPPAPGGGGGFTGASQPNLLQLTGGATPMPPPNQPLDWLGLTPTQANLPPEMAPPDVGGYQ